MRVELASPKILTLGIAQASLTLHSLNRIFYAEFKGLADERKTLQTSTEVFLEQIMLGLRKNVIKSNKLTHQ